MKKELLVVFFLALVVSVTMAAEELRRGLGNLPADPAFHARIMKKYDPAVFAGRGSLDWRDYGYVTSVKDQGFCGSCWAFACIGGMESRILFESGPSFDLSEQLLISCDTDGLPYENFGCCGGGYWGWDYFTSHSPWLEVTTTYGDYWWDPSNCSPIYPYCVHPNCSDVLCSSLGGNEQYWRVNSYSSVASTIAQIKAALTTEGPLYFGFEVYEHFYDYWYELGSWPDDIYYYSYGCFLGGHAVLLVGYNDDHPNPYWILKNSWGEGGPLGDGYFYIAQDQTTILGVQCAAVDMIQVTPTPTLTTPAISPAGTTLLLLLMGALLALRVRRSGK